MIFDNGPRTFHAKTLYGLEPVLAEELKKLGATDIEPHNRAVSFTGDQRMLYRANLWLRTATRILVPIFGARAWNEDSLYAAAQKLDWSQYFSLDETFAVHTTLNTDKFDHSLYVSLKVKDAIVDQFRDKFGRRPNVDKDKPDISIQVHISADQVTFLLDSSAISLHKRGYKAAIYKAPLSECLAAGMIMLTGWDGTEPLYDPMCGSGTILTEAALIAKNIAPGLYRESFGFMTWNDFDPLLWEEVVDEAHAAQVKTDAVIYGSDVSMVALDETDQNIAKAQLGDIIKLKQVAFEQGSAPPEVGMILTNPPYGERIEKDDMIEFYQEIGNTLKRDYAGWTAWIFSGNLQALKFVGLKPSRKIPLFNGPIECRLNRFDLYRGSKKASKQEDND